MDGRDIDIAFLLLSALLKYSVLSRLAALGLNGQAFTDRRIQVGKHPKLAKSMGWRGPSTPIKANIVVISDPPHSLLIT